jgi:hypothetical protein
MAYFSRRLSGKRTVSAEFVCLLIVVAAAAVTAYWAARTIGIQLSLIENAASALGFGENVATTPQVGYSQARVEVTPTPNAANCQAGEQPAFLNGMAALHEQIGGAMGTPLECEHSDGTLNSVQQTSAGLAAYDSQRNIETFTNGWHHWAWTPNGLVEWEGTSAEPPTATDASPDRAAAANPDEGPPQAADANDEDSASDAVATDPDQALTQAADANDEDNASDAVATDPDQASTQAADVNSDDQAGDEVAANQDDVSSDETFVINDDGASDPSVDDTQDDGSSQPSAFSEDDGSADAVTDNEAGDQR